VIAVIRRFVTTVGPVALIVGCGVVIVLGILGAPTPLATVVGCVVLLFVSRPIRAIRHR